LAGDYPVIVPSGSSREMGRKKQDDELNAAYEQLTAREKELRSQYNVVLAQKRNREIRV